MIRRNPEIIATEVRAMRSLRSRRSATPSGPSRYASWAKLAAAIAGALHDRRSLFIIGLILALTIFAYGAMA